MTAAVANRHENVTRLPDSDGGYLGRPNWRRRVWIPAPRRAGLACSEPWPAEVVALSPSA